MPLEYPAMRVDVHCHVGVPHLAPITAERFSFEPAGQYAPTDSYFSPRLKRSVAMWFARRYFHLKAGRDESAAIQQRLLDEILGARLIDRAVVLAFDQYHTTAGEPSGPRSSHLSVGSDLYVSNTYVRHLARQHPERILFGASIHPYRRGALAMLEEVATAGAVLVKWLPPAQNIDPADPRTVAFLRLAGRIGMPLLIHEGGEVSLGNLHPQHGDPSPLLATLRSLRDEGAMPTVIVAHAATPSVSILSARWHRALIAALLGEFRDAPLHSDVSGLGVFARGRWLNQLARMPEIHAKLVYGSDFPIPPNPLYFLPRIRGQYRAVRSLANIIDRDVALKQALGLPESVFTRGEELLRHRIAAQLPGGSA